MEKFFPKGTVFGPQNEPICGTCHEPLKGMPVSHQKKGFDDGGCEMIYRDTYYCPDCNETPSPIGEPIYKEQTRL